MNAAEQDRRETMHSGYVFDKFNEIIGPEFSLITGRTLEIPRIVDIDGGVARTVVDDEDNTSAVGNNEHAVSDDKVVTPTVDDNDNVLREVGDDGNIEPTVCIENFPGNSSDVRHEKQLVGTFIETDAPSDLENISNENDEKNSACDELSSGAKIARNLHWKLFELPEPVYIKRNSQSRTKVFEEECVLVIDIKETANHDYDGGDHDHDEAIHVLRCIRACHDGHRFGLVNHALKIGSSSEELVSLSAEDLGVIPMRLLPRLERQNIEARLVSRGKKYHSLCESSHKLMHYQGPVIPLDRDTDWTWTTNQRVVVDGTAGRKMQSVNDDNSSVAPHRGTSLELFLSNEGYPLPHSRDPSLSQGGNPVSGDAMRYAKGKQKSSEYEKTRGDHEWIDIDYLTCPPTLAAFLLDDNMWANVHVEHLIDVVWPENPFDSLELEIGKKNLIQNLTRRFKTVETSSTGSDRDTEVRQGGNLIILLSGPPGVGKTLTAEIVAEETRRPLYRVSAGELSFDPTALKKQLGDIYILARRWGAIVLIEEADILITKRRGSTPDQNAAVTAFLRLFHTYDGLLFLTSTSEDIDAAFFDQNHATIKYDDLDESQRTNIWHRQLQRAVRATGGLSPSSQWPEEAYQLLGSVETDGRDIRSIIRTAEQLALGLSIDLAISHVVATIRNFRGSDDYVESVCEKLEVLEGQLGAGEGKARDEDFELQQTAGETPDRL